MTTGMEYFCTGVGFPYLHKATLFSIISPSSTSANYTKCNKDTAQHQHKQFTSTRLQCSHCMWPQTYIFSRILTSNHNSRSIWSRRLASRSSPMNMTASRPPVEWHFGVTSFWRHFVGQPRIFNISVWSQQPQSWRRLCLSGIVRRLPLR